MTCSTAIGSEIYSYANRATSAGEILAARSGEQSAFPTSNGQIPGAKAAPGAGARAATGCPCFVEEYEKHWNNYD
ncbi:MAG: hypothetical protein DCC49_11740 [Acidobacteria bacterium]|nr:MAG: hypothetical protein DCC49_11740 [Acidobacteriota bacterium]